MGMPTPFNIFCIAMGIISFVAYSLGHDLGINYSVLIDIGIIALLVFTILRQNRIALQICENQQKIVDLIQHTNKAD